MSQAIRMIPAPRFVLALCAFAAGALSGCTMFAPQDDPQQVRIDDMDRRLGRVERVATPQTLQELSQRIDALQAELRVLRGQVEVLENGQGSGSEALRKQQRDLYADLDRRMAVLEGGTGRIVPGPAAASGTAAIGPAGANPSAPVPAPGSAGVDAPGRLYGRAFDALKAANYPAAIAGMREFISSYPRHELADNAQYWLGEAYYVTRDYENAITAFTTVQRDWPDSSKAPDALLKQGYAQFELKRYAAARQSLQQVGTRYPATEAARLAAERLQRLPPDAR